MSKTAIFISSRNNYSLLESFLERNPDLLELDFFNVDDNSDEEEQSLGKEICLKYKNPYIQNSGRGLQWSAQTIIDCLDDDYDFLIWTTHDSFTISENFYQIFNTIKSTLGDFGVVGFNILGPQCGISHPSQITKTTLGMLGRAPLANLPGRGGWYRTPDMLLDWDTWGGLNPIAIESPVDMTLAINVNLFKEYIKVTDNYHLFCAWDDICMQFLESGVYNVTLPYLQVYHDQMFKEGKVPVKSAGAAKKGDVKHFGHYGPHFEYWTARWGWDRDDVRNTFPLEKYKGTLIGDFFEMNYKDGPLKVFK